MAVALEQFVKQLADSGVIAPGKLEKFVPPNASPKDAQELARQLVQSKQLTKFQVQEIYLGRAKSLILGNYTILDKIGAGGMGLVFKAEHRRMHRIVAIKILPKAAVTSVSGIARFQREAEAAARLTHPNIVAAYDSDEANDIHFLAMEYVEGIDLAALVKKDGPVPLGRVVNYILQAARGLEFAHGEGVVHRDVKPANLLLDKKGTIKILDMGLAHVDSGPGVAAQAELTGSGAVLGTVDFMAPEQGRSTKSAGARADIYSLGCTFYYLLSGKPIYDGASVTAKLLAHQAHPIPDLRKLSEEVPEQLQAIFKKMVAKKIEDRYQTMSEVVASLEAYEASTSGVQHSASVLDPGDSELDSGVLSFLGELPKSTILKRRQAHHPGTVPMAGETAVSAADSTTVPAPRKLWRGNKKRLGIIAAAVLGLALMAGVLFSLRNSAGTLVVRINQPDVTVQVLNEAGIVEISQSRIDGRVAIAVRPGKHSLKVEKDGFQPFRQDFVIEAGGDQAIKVWLERMSKNPARGDPAAEQWTRELAGLSAEKRLEAVVKKLRLLNPDFDGKEEHKIENDLVTELSIVADSVADLSPVRALGGLKTLKCAGSGGAAVRLSDLTPLRGMHLARLNCDSTLVSDLSPLQGMPLEVLRCSGTHVSDLSPLAGMPLRELSCGWTGVGALWPLGGMHLTYLEVDGAPVADLRPLQGMPLTVLRCSSTRVFDLSPLRGMPLTDLQCFYTRVTNLSPLEGTRLMRFGFDATSIAKGIDAVRRMKSLTNIRIGRDGTEQFPADEFWKKYDAGEFAPGPETQIRTVVEKLQQLNPGFDGTETHDVESGAVTSLQFATDNVTDISPLRALERLKKLNIGGTGGGKVGKITDLTPLKGLPLTELVCYYAQVSDLSPLKGMKLTSLNCGGSAVTELAPLKGMPLTFLNCGGTAVSDLSPLQNMPLTNLWIDSTPVADLSPLKGMPLVELGCEQSRVADLSPLKGMPLTRLEINATGVHDLSPLAGMPLTILRFGDTTVSDLSPLKGMPLKQLGCMNTQVSDLSPLEGMPLTWVAVDDSVRVSDLSPLKSAKLEILHCNNTRVTDLSMLKGMPVKDISWTPRKIVKGIDTLRQMTGIEKIGASVHQEVPPAEFWAKYDAGEFNALDANPAFKAWMKEVAAMPPDNQVFAVISRLRDFNVHSDGKETHKIESGVVSELHLSADQIADLSPVRALAGLKGLYCGGGSPGSGILYDLSPLRGMALTGLKCTWSQVADLSPLAGMPITYLDCGGTPVHDLSPLRGMPLTTLRCSGAPVSDLSPLAGTPLRNLYCDRTNVADLSPLKGLSLEIVTLTPKNIAKGLDVVRQMKSLDRIGVGWQPQDIFSPDEFWKKFDAGEFK